jgi:hypothetical protein
MKEKQKEWSLKDKLKGEELNAIQFVMDYLQIHFNDKGFTFYIWPSLNINNNTYEFGCIDYRNKLWELIGKIVSDVHIIENDLLVIEFETKERIQLNINPDNPDIMNEIAIFWDEDGGWAVFE